MNRAASYVALAAVLAFAFFVVTRQQAGGEDCQYWCDDSFGCNWPDELDCSGCFYSPSNCLSKMGKNDFNPLGETYHQIGFGGQQKVTYHYIVCYYHWNCTNDVFYNHPCNFMLNICNINQPDSLTCYQCILGTKTTYLWQEPTCSDCPSGT